MLIEDLSGDWAEFREFTIGGVRAHSQGMTPQDLKDRTKKFAVDVIKFAKTAIPRDQINNEIAAQLTDAAGATASGYRATCRARSRADFVYQLGNAIEEADESAFWLEVLIESEIVPTARAKPLWQEADELTRILVRSRETARKPR
jgi:four helix bundle protein